MRGEDALAKMAAAYGYGRGVTVVCYLVAQQCLGRRDEALAYCAHALANEREDSAHRVMIAPGLLAIYCADLASLAAAVEHCAALQNLANDLPSYFVAIAHWLQCRLARQRGVVPTPPGGQQ